MDMTAALKQLDEWSFEDRIRFIEAAWDRLLDKGYDPPVTDAQRAELQRRMAAHEAAPDQIVPWEIVRENLRKRP